MTLLGDSSPLSEERSSLAVYEKLFGSWDTAVCLFPVSHFRHSFDIVTRVPFELGSRPDPSLFSSAVVPYSKDRDD